MITPSAAAHKISRAQNLVVVWSPWWHVYLTRCDFTYVYDESLSIMGSSSLVMTVGLEFVQSHNLMDIAIALEFALQQSLRSMDSRAQQYEKDHPTVRRDIIGLGQSLEINDDIDKKFSSVSEYQWIDIASKVIDKSYLASYDATSPPHLPQGWLTPEDCGFESGLSAEKYIHMIIEKNEQEEEEHLNQDDEDKPQEEQQQGQEQEGDQQQQNKEEKQGQEGDKQQQGQEQEKGEEDKEQYSSIKGEETNGEGSNFSNNSGSGSSGSSSGSQENSHSSNDSFSVDGKDDNKSGQSDTQEGNREQGESAHNDKEDSLRTKPEGSTDETSSLQQPSSPFRGDYSLDDHHVSPSSINNDTQTPPPVNAQPHRIDSPQQQGNDIQGNEDVSTRIKEDDLSSIENTISQSYDDIHNDIPDRGKSTPQKQSHEKGDPEKIENPWEGQENKPSGKTSPQSTPPPQHNQQDDMAAVEAHLANDMDDSTPQGTQEDHDKLAQEYQHLVDRLKDSTGTSGEHNFDIPQHRQDSSAVGLSSEERAELDKELAESIQEHSNSLPTKGGFTAGDSFIAWSNEKLRKPVVPWQKVLRKLVTLSVSRAQMAGQSDLSYAKQNPNQQPDMPIMMGFITYPPEVTVLVDASPSMIRRKKKTISEFAGVVQKILIQYSQPVVMAAADNSIKYATYSTSPARSIIKNIGKTFDGSSAKFGDTVARVAKKGVKFRGRNYPSPDVLILFTDCLFHWPLAENTRLPLSYATVIVASTEPYEDVKDYLPRWVKEKKNFVHIND